MFKLLETIIEKSKFKMPPFLSGAASIYLFDRTLEADMESLRFCVAIGGVLVLFLGSIFLYYYLSKLEQKKDVGIVKSIEHIVRNVFCDYGGKTQENKNAKEMNHIMQTIVNLLKNLNSISGKDYKR